MYGSAANFGGTPPFNAMPHGNPPLNNFAFNQQQQQQMLASSMPQAPHSQAPHSQAQPQPQSQQQQEKIPEPLASAYKRQDDGPILWFAGPPLNITESKPIHSTAYLKWRRAKHTN